MKTINIRKFPEELLKLAKIAAAKEGKTLQDWFIEAVREKIERDEKKYKTEAARSGAPTPQRA